ncbi:TPA: hypothetical protein RKZ72_004076, partial [Enterobacter cloacae]|nr:hypothetical protein [Enterobacter cloacae]
MAWYDITGTVADWVMASAAVYAAFSANHWFSQRLHSKGLDKAEEILLSIDNAINELDSVRTKLDEAKYYLDAINSKEIKADYEAIKIYDQTSTYLADKFNHVNTVRHNVKLLNRWNVETKKEAIFDDVLNNFSKFFFVSTQSISLAHKSIYDICYMTDHDFENTYAEFNSCYKLTQVAFEEIHEAYSVLTSN